MNRPTVKKSIIRALAISTSVEMLEKNEVILVTAAGLIFGKLPAEEAESILPALTMKVVDDYKALNNIEKDETLPGDDGYLVLENVEILNNGSTSKFPSLVVFYDQIIGVTIGNIS